jgi:hypothetical protein
MKGNPRARKIGDTLFQIFAAHLATEMLLFSAAPRRRRSYGFYGFLCYKLPVSGVVKNENNGEMNEGNSTAAPVAALHTKSCEEDLLEHVLNRLEGRCNDLMLALTLARERSEELHLPRLDAWCEWNDREPADTPVTRKRLN